MLGAEHISRELADARLSEWWRRYRTEYTPERIGENKTDKNRGRGRICLKRRIW